MRSLIWGGVLLFSAECALAAPATGQEADNHFASIYVDDDQAGVIHFHTLHNADGDLEELQTKLSVKVLGISVYSFAQSLHEEWKDGRLHRLTSHTDDDGKVSEVSLEFQDGAYKATLNKKPVDLPAEAFPLSVWHYAMTEQDLLFSMRNLKQYSVKAAKSEEELTIDDKKIPVDRFDITGEWEGVLWFDKDRSLVQFQYKVDKHEVRVVLDR